MKFVFTLVICIFSLKLFAGRGDTISVSHPTAITLSVTQINTTCQASNGKIIVQATGGIVPYDYSINGPFANQPSGVFYNLPAGNYTVTATDAAGTMASQNVTLTNTLVPPTVSGAHNITRPSGCNTHDAGFTIDAAGGTPPYLYSIDNINFQTSNVFTGLTAGGYAFMVKDANGCTTMTSIFAFNNITGILTSLSCSLSVTGGTGGSDGCNPKHVSIQLPGSGNLSGGVPPYKYSVDSINFQTYPIFNNLPYGVNNFWIKDAAGNIVSFSTSTLDACPSPFTVACNAQTAICGQNGSISVNATDGQAPYQYSIDGINYQLTSQFTGLAPATYTVWVKDSYDEVATKLVRVFDHCTIVTAAIFNSTCGNNNGKIEVHAANGTAPYQYSIDGVNFGANNIFTNLPAANYTLYAKDAAGMTGNTTVIINNIAGPQISSINITPTGCDNHSGKIIGTAQAGTAPLLYSIDGTTFKNTGEFDGMAQGNYTFTVKDANGCISSQPAIVTMNSDYPVVNLGKDTTLCEGATLLLNATSTGSTYLWQDGKTTATYLVQQPGKYTVQATRNGCTTNNSVTVDYHLRPRFTLGADRTLCIGEEQTIKPVVDSLWQLMWQDGSTAKSYVVLEPGLYALTATNECGSSRDEILFTKGLCKIYVPNAFTPNGDNKNDKLQVYGTELVTGFNLKVFNRYGQPIFQTKDKNAGWDGTIDGMPQPAGTYVWTISYTTAQDNKTVFLKGVSILIR